MKEQSKYYIINYKHRGAGFFAYLNAVFGRLSHCNQNNLTPVVDWSEPKVEYYDSEMGDNPFDYYFEQDVTIEEALKLDHEHCPEQYVNYPPSGLKINRNPEIVIDLHRKYDSINILLDRTDEGVHNDDERFQNLEEGIAIDTLCKKVLDENGVPHHTIKVGPKTVKDILKLL